MIKTGIMGGTFNPVHNAHLLIAEYAREQLGLESVWFMTSGNPPHKRGAEIIDARIRQEMVALAAADNPYFEVCPYEAERERYSYTADTLTEFSALYPDREFYFIIGADSLAQMNGWYKPEVIAKRCVIAVFGRKGIDGLETLAKERAAALGADIRLVDAPIMEISSSVVRGRIRSGKSVRYMLPESVRKYIEENNLYQNTAERR